MMCAFYLAPGAKSGTRLTDRAEILETFHRREGLLWIDMEAATEEETDWLGEQVLGLHPVAVQTCREVTSQPLVHDYDDYLFMVIHAVDFERQAEAVTTLEVDVFWGRNFVLTYHRDPIRTISEVRDRCGQNGGVLLSRGSDFFMHALVDRIIDNFTPTLDRIDDLIEEVEQQIFRRPTDAVLKRALDLKRAVAYLWRVATAQRDVVGRIVRGEFPQIKKQALAYWRDAYDHLVRMVQSAENQRDLIAAARDTYLSVVSNRMNEVMKVLTIIATIFIPLTFIAGVYGMNFEWMPELKQPWAYPAVLGVMMLVTLGMLWFFRRKKWI
ncbi:MAG: magnesium/cobalt transporter CorA [Phycisphaerae bacterium]